MSEASSIFVEHPAEYEFMLPENHANRFLQLGSRAVNSATKFVSPEVHPKLVPTDSDPEFASKKDHVEAIAARDVQRFGQGSMISLATIGLADLTSKLDQHVLSTEILNVSLMGVAIVGLCRALAGAEMFSYKELSAYKSNVRKDPINWGLLLFSKKLFEMRRNHKMKKHTNRNNETATSQ